MRDALLIVLGLALAATFMALVLGWLVLPVWAYVLVAVSVAVLGLWSRLASRRP